jgi:hypothetical protein
MFFTLLLGLSAFLVAGSAAYFSVLGIATLFAGSYFQVMIMAGSLEFGKLVATSYLYRYWNKTVWWLKLYLILAVLALMGITSMGVFGYLSAAYQVNSSKFAQIDSQIGLIEQQKKNIDSEVLQINSRIETLNKSRLSQEQRLPNLSKQAAAPIYADIERSGAEIKSLSERSQILNTQKIEKDSEIIQLNSEISKTKDIGTFKFVANVINQPLDYVVILFICVLIAVFDPLAVSLVLAFNVATSGKILKEPSEALEEKLVQEEPAEDSPQEKEVKQEQQQEKKEEEEPTQSIRSIGFNL